MKEEIIAATPLPESLSGVLPATSTADSAAAPACCAGSVDARIGRFRWTICALLFFATTINYIDRQVIGILSKDLKSELDWNEIAYGNSFLVSSDVCAGLDFGRPFDGSVWYQIGYAGALLFWSLAAMGHAFAAQFSGLVSLGLLWVSVNQEIFLRPSRPRRNGFLKKSAP